MSLLGVAVDTPAFLVNVLTGSSVISNGSAVPVYATFPQTIVQLPTVAIQKTLEDPWEWISLPAVRRRHYSHHDVTMWAATMQDRYSLMTSVRTTINSVAAAFSVTRTSYSNFVWMQIINESDATQPDIVPPMYQTIYDVEIIWDEGAPVPI